MRRPRHAAGGGMGGGYQPAAARSGGNREGGGVPAGVGAVGARGRRRAPGERHQDPVSTGEIAPDPPGALPGVVPVVREAPGAGQVDPVVALEVGTRVFGKRNRLGALCLRGDRTGERREPGDPDREPAKAVCPHDVLALRRDRTGYLAPPAPPGRDRTIACGSESGSAGSGTLAGRGVAGPTLLRVIFSLRSPPESSSRSPLSLSL